MVGIKKATNAVYEQNNNNNFINFNIVTGTKMKTVSTLLMQACKSLPL